MEDFTSLHSKIFDEIKENNVIIYTPHCAFKYNKLIFNYHFIEQLVSDKKICVIADDKFSLEILYHQIKSPNLSVNLYISDKIKRNAADKINKIKRNLKSKVLILSFRRLLNILRYGLLKISDISHILIQGSHKIYKNSALRHIFNEFYLNEPLNSRSRIISITPVLLSNITIKHLKNEELISKRLMDLKNSLQSVIMYPEDEIFYGDCIGITIKCSQKVKNNNYVVDFKKLKSSTINKLFLKWINELELCYIELGYYAYRKLISRIYSHINHEKSEVGSVNSEFCSYMKTYALTIYQHAIDLFENEFSESLTFEPLKIQKSDVSVKFKLLRNILLKEVDKAKGQRTIGLVIINSKILSEYLGDMIQQVTRIKSCILSSGNIKNLHEIISNNTNDNLLLISTRVIFENFNTIPLHYVVDYDSIRTIDEHSIALSKLEKNGSYYMLTNNYKKKELMAKNISTLRSIILQNDLKLFEKKDFSDTYVFKCDNATHSYSSAVDSFHYYIAQLPDLKDFKSPLFAYFRNKDMWTCKIKFPLLVPLNVIESSGSTKKEAKQLACFKAMKILYEDYKIINEYFRPKRKIEIDYKNYLTIKDYHEKKERKYELVCPNVLCSEYKQQEKTFNGFIYKFVFSGVNLDPNQDIYLGIIFPRKLYDSYQIKIPQMDESTINVKVQYIKEKEIKKSKLQTIHDYHFWTVVHSDFKQKDNFQANIFKKYFLCLIKDDNIEYDLMSLVTNIKKNVDKLTPLKDAFTNDEEFRGKYLYLDNNDDYDNICKFDSSIIKNQSVSIIAKIAFQAPFISPVQKRKYLYNKILSSSISQFYMFPLQENIMESLGYISFIMSYIEGYSRSQYLTHDIIGAPLPYEISHMCLTAKSTKAVKNYEILEFLGDCCLKLYACVYISLKYPYYTKEQSSLIKESIVSNSNLFSRAQLIQLGNFINVKEWSWMPTAFEKNANYTHEIKDKIISDCFEALLGAYKKYGTKEDLNKFLLKCGLEYLIINETCKYQSFNEITDIEVLEKLKQVETIIGYSFNCKEYLLSSLVHPSYSSFTQISTYHRFQPIGDAIIDYFSTFFYLDKFENLTPDIATSIRSCLSCKATKAYHFIRLGLYQYVYENRNLIDRIKSYESLINERKDELTFEDIISSDFPPYHDFLTALLGAVFIDTNLNEEKTFQVFDRIYSEFFMKYFTSDSKIFKMPASYFREKFSVRFRNTVPTIEKTVLRVPRIFFCSIKNNEEQLGSAIGSTENAALRIASYLSLMKI